MPPTGGIKPPSAAKTSSSRPRLSAEEAETEFKRRSRKIILAVLEKLAPNHVYSAGKEHMVKHLLDKVFAKEVKHTKDRAKLDVRCPKVKRYVTEYVEGLVAMGKFL